MKILRAETTAHRAGAYYVRIQAMAVKHHITLEQEFDEHDTPDTHYLVILDDVLPVGTLRMYALNDNQVMLGRIVVLPEYRHRGIGTSLVQEAERWAKELGYDDCVLESRVNKTAFYERMGYRADYAKVTTGDNFTCVHMEKHIGTN